MVPGVPASEVLVALYEFSFLPTLCSPDRLFPSTHHSISPSVLVSIAYLVSPIYCGLSKFLTFCPITIIFPCPASVQTKAAQEFQRSKSKVLRANTRADKSCFGQTLKPEDLCPSRPSVLCSTLSASSVFPRSFTLYGLSRCAPQCLEVHQKALYYSIVFHPFSTTHLSETMLTTIQPAARPSGLVPGPGNRIGSLARDRPPSSPSIPVKRPTG
jgi:hypothetical protein